MTDVFISPSSQWANQFAGGTSGVEDSEGKHMRDIAPLIHSLCRRNGIDSHLSMDESLYARVQESNRMAPKLHFALHSNAGGTAFGASTWVYTLGTKSEVMARAIQRRLAAITPWSDLGTIRYNHYETRETTSYAVIAEVAFHDKVTPAEWIRTHKRDIAIACTQGIIDALAAAYGGRFADIAARPLMLDGGAEQSPIITATVPEEDQMTPEQAWTLTNVSNAVGAIQQQTWAINNILANAVLPALKGLGADIKALPELDADTIAALIPDALAAKVADLLAARLSS